MSKYITNYVVSVEGCYFTDEYGIDSRGRLRTTIGGKEYKVHRLVYEEEHGEIPEGAACYHKCDNPSCINPDHIFLGTHQDNMTDMVKKGRQARGEGSGRTDLTDETAYLIKFGCKSLSNSAIAKALGIDKGTVWEIRSGYGWKHITENAPCQ